MGALGNLFNNAAGGQVEVKDDTSVPTIGPASNVQDILDWVMVRLCTGLDIEEMAFK